MRGNTSSLGKDTSEERARNRLKLKDSQFFGHATPLVPT